MQIRVIPLALVALAAPLAAQQAPRTLPEPQAEFEEPFSAITIGGVRELRDGRVIVADPRDKLVSLVDFRSGTATRVGREGAGPQEFGLPSRLFVAPGDSTYLFDPLNSRYLLIGPDGRPINTFMIELGSSTAAAPARQQGAPPQAVRPQGGAPGAGGPPPGGARPGGQGSARPGGQGGAPGQGRPAVAPAQFGMVSLNARASDSRGRLYAEGSPLRVDAEGRPQTSDSVPLLRYDRSTRRTDTLTHIALPKSNTNVSGGQNNMRIVFGGSNPLAPRDEWHVFPDGRVAVVRASDYHVDFILPDGSKRSGPRIPYTPIRMTAAEIRHEEALREAARANQMTVMISNNNGQMSRSAQMGPGPNAPPLEPLTDWPEVKPAFRPGQASVIARPNGELWVRRTENAQARGTLYDVIDAQGAVAYQVRLEDGVTLVGFGENSIYTARKDEDDLVYLRKHSGF